MAEIQISLKWSKQLFALSIQSGESGQSLKEKVYSLTRVPIERQKLLLSKNKNAAISWKGSLSDEFVFDFDDDTTQPLVVTLIGSAEAADQAPVERIKFVEDMTETQKREIEEATENAALETATGMIPALQFPPHLRDDGKQEMYQYNRMVTGLPQRSIEDLLKQKKSKLLGKVAMTMGLELRRAYISDMASLRDGTLISALDDGHIQLWKHGELDQDLIHDGAGDGGVDSLVVVSSESSNIAFCTGGRGCFKLWTDDGKEVLSLPAPIHGASPLSLVQVPVPGDDRGPICLAACFKITIQSNPSQFHLVPQDAAARRRRNVAQAQEAERQRMMDHMSRSIEIIYESENHEMNTKSMKSYLLTPEDERSAPITCLTTVSTKSESFLVSGDVIGGLRIWKPQAVTENGINHLKFVQQAFTQLVPEDGSCSIVCMEPLGDGRHLAVSTASTANMDTIGSFGTSLSIPSSRAVYILDMGNTRNIGVIRVLQGHTKDAVQCMCALPNGDLMTGGGKLDATLQLWESSQLISSDEGSESLLQNQSSQSFSDVGYVFGLTVLKDKKPGSSEFAVAAARYNTVKIVL